MLLAIDAHVRRPRACRRTRAAGDDFFQGFLETSLAPDELLTEIRVPKCGPGSWSYQKFNRRAQDWAIVGAWSLPRNGDDTRRAREHGGARRCAPLPSSPRWPMARPLPTPQSRQRTARIHRPISTRRRSTGRTWRASWCGRGARADRRGCLIRCASRRPSSRRVAGERLVSNVPKPLTLLAGRPLVTWALDSGARHRAQPRDARRGSPRRRGRRRQHPSAVMIVHAPRWHDGHRALTARRARRRRAVRGGHARCASASPISRSSERMRTADSRRRTRPARRLAVATYAGVRGNPVLLGRELWDEARALRATSVHER